MNRFYVPFHAGLKNVWIDSSESHHIVHVKRLKIGDHVIVFNGMGDEFDAEIEEIKDNRVNVKINQQKTIIKENTRFDRGGIPLEVVIPYEKFVAFVEEYGLDLTDEEREAIREAKSDLDAGRLDKYISAEDIEKEFLA